MLRRFLTRLYRDERGAEGLEKILIIAAIVLPLLGLLLAFKDRISTLVNSWWEQVQGPAATRPPDPTAVPPSQ